MKIERTKNAARNIVFGLFLKIYQILMPFLMRTVMIYFMGVQYLGLNSLFTSILQVLNLAELGVGSAMVFSMYRPIAEDNRSEICALMRLYRVYYRMIGTVIGLIGLCLMPFVPYLIKGDIPQGLNIYVLYLLNLGATVLSYWLFAYKNCLLAAHQRVDLTSKVTLATHTLQYLLQAAALCFLHDYYAYLLIMLGSQAATNIITAVVAGRQYPYYRPEGHLPEKKVQAINHRIRDLFTSKLGAVIVNSADTLVISAFLGLTVLAVYQNYFFILSSVIGLVTIVFNACMAGIGNSIVVETGEKNFQDLRKITLIISWIAGFCTCCFLCLYQPFMEIWVGKKLQLGFSAVICFCIYYYIYETNQILTTYKDAAGIWHQDRFRPLATALTNLVMNLIMVQFWGIYGVLLSTVLSTLIVGMPWLLHNLFTVLFDHSLLKVYLKQILFHAAVTFTVCTATALAASLVRGSALKILIIRAVICCTVPNILFFAAYCRMEVFGECMLLLDRVTGGKLPVKALIGKR